MNASPAARTDAGHLPFDFEQLFRSMPGLVTVLDRSLRIVQCNVEFKQTFAGALGEPCWRVCKGRLDPCPDCPAERTFRTGVGQSFPETLVSGRSDPWPVMVYTSPLRDPSGLVTHVLQHCVDVSAATRLQARLNRAQQRFRQLFDEVPCYVSVQDRDLKVTAANRSFKEDFGDEIGMHCFELYKHRDEPCLECPVMKTFEDGEHHQSEEVVCSASGERYNVLVHTAPLRDATGAITQVMEMSTNITEIRRLESQLASLGLLIGSISHGIKGLLTAIDGGSYLVNSGFAKNDPERIRNGWQIVQRNMRRMRSMVLDMLYYARDRELAYEPVSCVDLASEVWNTVSFRAEELGVGFEHALDIAAGSVLADPAALRTALVNLVENALDACRLDKKKARHRVTLSASPDGDDAVVFEIRDNGMGMDRETQDKMFSLFFSSKGSEGTGLGLFISNKIVRQHGGTIEVESTIDVGTRFFVRLPRSPPPRPAAVDPTCP